MSHASLLVAIEPAMWKGDIEESVHFLMAPFDENGEWFSEGSRWDWWTVGGRYDGELGGSNALKRSEVDLAAMKQHRILQFSKWYDEAMLEPNAMHRSMAFDLEPDETREAYIQRKLAGSDFPTFYAFLRGREWHERDRLGWFGGTARTECKCDEPEHKGRCIHECPQSGARIISWDDDPKWAERFYDRFVRRLSPETTLVSVDYHV